ncbi:transglycosylase SLT domain-containing protein [Desulfocapsa sp. AH-315-G09]|nr:transglycosylase SLT domain-containing protein [Desulfocapsa sp.]MBN4065278.1 transglycosylase SLT domain-containing protein [Desulfocapsa sp. AH-315-G09]
MPQVTKYDQHFKIYADIYFGGEVSWQWFKAMGIAESSLNPRAVSPVGAMGIMQLMPPTSAQVARELWIADDPLDPKINILMGIHYARKMWTIFKKEQGLERLCFMFGAYNAGAGNIIKAQGRAKLSYIWDDIADALPQVTGKHAMETIQYVERILDIRQKMI